MFISYYFIFSSFLVGRKINSVNKHFVSSTYFRAKPAYFIFFLSLFSYVIIPAESYSTVYSPSTFCQWFGVTRFRLNSTPHNTHKKHSHKNIPNYVRGNSVLSEHFFIGPSVSISHIARNLRNS